MFNESILCRMRDSWVCAKNQQNFKVSPIFAKEDKAIPEKEAFSKNNCLFCTLIK